MGLRISWPKIKEMGLSNEAVPFLFVLPSGGRELLLSIFHMLDWEATFRTDGYDYADWDELQAIVASTQHGLMGGEDMGEIADAILLLRQSLIDKPMVQDCPEITLSCCNDADGIGFPDEPPGDIPEYPEPWPTDPEPTEPTYEDYKCRATTLYLDRTEYIIEQFMELTLQQSPYDWVHDLLTEEEFGNPIYSVLVATLNFIINNFYGALKEELLAMMTAMHDDILCAIFNAATVQAAKDAVGVIIDDYPTGWVKRLIFRSIVIDSTDISPLWVENEVDTTGYEGADCSMCVPQESFSFDFGLNQDGGADHFANYITLDDYARFSGDDAGEVGHAALAWALHHTVEPGYRSMVYNITVRLSRTSTLTPPDDRRVELLLTNYDEALVLVPDFLVLYNDLPLYPDFTVYGVDIPGGMEMDSNEGNPDVMVRSTNIDFAGPDRPGGVALDILTLEFIDEEYTP